MATTDYNVIIIGAGLSGLSAAKRLKARKADMSVLILEAYDEVGGRTRSMDITGPKGIEETLDLGGHWVSTKQPLVLELMKELGVDHYPQNIKGKKVMQVGDNKVRTYTSDIPSLGSWLALVDVQRMITKIEKLVKEVDIRDPYAHPQAHHLDQITVASYVRAMTDHQGVYDMINAAMQASMGTDASELSMLYMAAYANAADGFMNLLLVEDGAAQEFRVKGGSQNICRKLQAQLADQGVTVMTGKPVVGVDSSDKDNSGGVRVSCADGSSFCCQHVVCTTIASQTAKISFQPALAMGRQSLLKQMKIGNLCKIFVIYEEPFWTKNGYSGELVSSGGPSTIKECENGPLTITYDATTSKGLPALVAFSGGRNADQWFSRSREERHKAITKQLEDCFGKEAANVKEIIEMNWLTEKWTGGAPVSYLSPGYMHNFHYLRQPHDKVVHFAGTETATEWCGYLTGAIQAGFRAAAEVLEDLDKDLLTKEDRKLLKDARPKSKAQYRETERETPASSGSRCTLM